MVIDGVWGGAIIVLTSLTAHLAQMQLHVHTLTWVCDFDPPLGKQHLINYIYKKAAQGRLRYCLL